MSMPSTNSAATPKRIINKIPLDFNKLKKAGLDRKLAEALGKQNLTPKRDATLTTPASEAATTTRTSVSTVPSAPSVGAAQSTTESATTATQQQKPQLEILNAKIAKSFSKNVVAVNEQTLHIKALLKNRILSKAAARLSDGAATTPTIATTTTNANNSSAASTSSGGFNGSVTKADLTTRQQPLVLNLLNQLPKQRATCGKSSSKRKEQPPPAAERGVTPVVKRASSSPANPPTVVAKSPPPAPLIVLENKVLAPDEKIDLRNLHLPASTPLKKIINLPSKLPPAPKGKVILNANKLKMPREKLALLAKEIRKQAEQQKQPGTAPPTDVVPSSPAIPNDISIISPCTDIHTSLISPVEKVNNTFSPSHVPTSIGPRSPDDKSSSGMLSAVDFIAQLTASKPIDQTNVFELSAEEAMLNAKFNSIKETVRPKTPEQELPIGKILKLQDLDILHATVNNNEPNVVRISPNPMKMQSNSIDNQTINTSPKKDNASSVGKNDIPTVKEINKTVGVHTEESAAKEEKLPEEEEKEKPQDKPFPYRVRKGQVQLVQRKKRPIVSKLQETSVVDSEKNNVASTETAGDISVVIEEPKSVDKLPKDQVENKTKNSIAKSEESTKQMKKITEESRNITIRTETPKDLSKIEKTEIKNTLSKFKTDQSINNMKEKSVEETRNRKSRKSDEQQAKYQDEKPQKEEIPKSAKQDAKPVEKTKDNDMVKIKDESDNAHGRNKKLVIKTPEKFQKPAEVVPNEAEDTKVRKKSGKSIDNISIETANKATDELKSYAFKGAEEEAKNSPAEDTHDETATKGNMLAEKEKDLTQLYRPPKMPKLKQKLLNKSNNNNETKDAVVTTTSVNLLEVLSREEPAAQGEAKVPFKVSKQPVAENQQTAEPALPVQPAEQTAGKSTTRKKLIKTRPVLSAKRPAKPAAEAVHPRKRALLAESKAKNGQRVTTSSTSDDDGLMFHGFDEDLSNSRRVKQLKSQETDISDDTTPDCDETEEEPLTTAAEHKEQPKPSVCDVSVEDAQCNLRLLSDVALEKTTTRRNNKRGKDHEAAKVTKAEQVKSQQETTKEEHLELAKLKPLTTVNQRSTRKSLKPPLAATPTAETEAAEVIEEPATAKRKSKRGTKETPEVQLNAEETTQSKRQTKRKISTAELDTSAAELKPKTETRRGRQSLPAVSVVTPQETATPNDTSLSAPKKRGRKSANELFAKRLKTENNAIDTMPGWPDCSGFDLRLLLITQREQLELQVEQLRLDGQGEGSDQCGLCLKRCNKAQWQTHLGEHYGIGWTMEKTPALLNRHGLTTMINAYLKAGNSLCCRICQRQLGTGLGLLLHMESCGAKQRVECEICKKSYSKLSYPVHYRTCLVKRTQLQEKADKMAAAEEMQANVTVFSNAGRAKRKSTIKAENKLGKLAALTEQETKAFESDASDYDAAKDNESSEEDGSEGVDSNEDAPVSEEDEPKERGRIKTMSKRNSSKISAGDLRKSLLGRISKLDLVVAERWAFFEKTNYSKQALYAHWKPLFTQLSAQLSKELLPSKEFKSMRYAYNKLKNDNWQQLAPLESFNQADEHVCYLGSAIKQLAWVPLPAEAATQYLLCAQRAKMLGYARQLKPKLEDALLLLLACNQLSKGKQDWALETRLHYGIRVREGPVHSFAFMPSGGFDKALNRLALLAVANTSSTVQIYALPLQVEDCHQGVVLELQALLMLSLDIAEPVLDACTKICWSEAAGHNFLVTGYASGNIAFWDLLDTSGLNALEHNNQQHLLPANYFYFGERNIYHLELHYDTKGPRWLAVGTSVRKLCVYDIKNWLQPLPIISETVANFYLSCLSWPSLWEAFVAGSSEIFKLQYARLITLNPSGIAYTHGLLDFSISSPRSLHFNCQQTLTVASSDRGDVIFTQSLQINLENALRKRSTKVRTMGATEPVYLNGKEQPESLTAAEFRRDYGLLLQPLANMPNGSGPNHLSANRRISCFDLSNLLRVNCVRWNWNKPARNWVAAGAEHGLLRIFNLEPDKHFESKLS
ncbi:uncharacterized protein LOC108600748 [Drosophila busckii]|uniref:uncharacterized protein LOC108600748 n=1 Tax=Drosophila busckii TaxID=30019 RepID=UPI001432BA1D|nr:uncharacterized protein LOC108600748 [Drosophila busckii]